MIHNPRDCNTRLLGLIHVNLDSSQLFIDDFFILWHFIFCKVLRTLAVSFI